MHGRTTTVRTDRETGGWFFRRMSGRVGQTLPLGSNVGLAIRSGNRTVLPVGGEIWTMRRSPDGDSTATALVEVKI